MGYIWKWWMNKYINEFREGWIMNGLHMEMMNEWIYKRV